MRLRVTKAARADLVTIRKESIERWGAVSADAYIDRLRRDFDRLLEFPLSGSPRDYMEGMRVCLSGSHMIFYIPDSERVRIVRVLHARMDHEAMLRSG